ncbi:sensor histidine kinase [Streptomyces sp. Vc74B-19]|uniref:sensor histidine kinase n=1 Tax=Streptomyces sp. Vc74B-19 TaxID=2741324 RepID=UPI001BFC2A28|nr:histidine kinase [Streptomyces sp. Vc74B-19]MBT3168133.1 sensor histidine kinase [Streptomyces sp. Vc74B-19]MCO4699636.1 sensor histidine kinase [Streptomyces sp. RO-S4]
MSRSSRDRLVDLLTAIGAAALSVTVSYAHANDLAVFPRFPSGTAFVEEFGRLVSLPVSFYSGAASALLIATAAGALLWWRRRWPVQVAVVLVILSVVWPLIPAALVALCTVAATRPVRTVAAVTALALLPCVLYLAVYTPSSRALSTVVTGAVLVGGAVGWGLFLRGLRERTEQARTEAALRAEHARQREREAIAHEMHDTLAHRLSLLSVHAGALQVNPGAPTEQVQQAAGVIRDSAHQALEELQQLLGVLRTPPTDASRSSAPQPVLADLTRLVQESRGAGSAVDLVFDCAPADMAAAPPAMGRTAYRIVQEALTNARKHAPGQPVRLVVRGAPGAGLTIEVTNPVTPGSTSPVPGSGLGLVGLTERAALAGGELRHELRPDGGDGVTHRLLARLPWPAA